ncbi:hypothetical protein QZH41_012930 [Actinostola sp. cb2023]|nr:hypothetical protein QZH41_012930 [Actinostola sp. cb2023]
MPNNITSLRPHNSHTNKRSKMAEVGNDCFPSKRIRLSPERENNIISTSTEQVIDKDESIIDEEPLLSSSSVFQASNVDPSLSREQDGDNDDFHKHDQFEGGDFPSCFSVEDDIGNSEEHHYQPIAGPMGWVQRQMSLGVSPREILSYMVPHAKMTSKNSIISFQPSELQDDHITLWKIIIDLLTAPTHRRKLDHVNTLDDVVSLLLGCKNIVVLTGAGVSVSCGIPDFRSRDGIYARLSEEYPDLPDPQAMFDITYFNQNPHPFFKFAKEIYPGQFKPSLSHRFIQQIEKHGCLLRNYSQNIDTLEQIAGITRVIQCHGSFSTASCTNCKYQVSSSDIKDDIFNQRIPVCSKCKQEEGTFATMKPDIVFFGENLPSDFYHHLEDDSEKADLLIVIGSSLKVRPVALIPSRIDADVPQILINREPLRHMTFDVELLGDCDVIVAELCRRLGGSWTDILEGSKVFPVDRSLYLGITDSLDTPSTSDSMTAAEEKNLEECPGEECPGEECPGEECPGEECPGEECPGEECPGEECPSEECPGEECPGEECPGEECPGEECPSEECLGEECPEKNQKSSANSTLEKHSLKKETSSNLILEIVTATTETLPEQHYGIPSQTSSLSKDDPPSSPGTAVQVDVQETESTTIQSVGQDTSCMSTDDQRQGIMAPSDTPLATEYPSNQESTPNYTSEDPPIFIYHPPNRYIFYGAEITNSPVHSPFASPVPSDDSNSEDCCNSDNGSLSRDDFECSTLEGNDYSSSADGSEGYGSGVMSNTDYSSYELKLITGALGSYHCVSEENSVMSAVDLIGESTIEHGSEDLLHISDVLSQSCVPQTGSSDAPDSSDDRLDSSETVSLLLKDNPSDATQESIPCDSTVDTEHWAS